jgi:membrane associated rhomboid family serine protease
MSAAEGLVNDPLSGVNRFLDEHLTPAVKLIMLLNIGVFLLTVILAGVAHIDLVRYCALPGLTDTIFNPWRIVTYMFLHGSFLHLLFNMLGLWFFGPPLENRWGTRRFWQFFLIVGAGAGLLNQLVNFVVPIEGLSTPWGTFPTPVIGASGAIYGLILAVAAYNPNGTIILYFFPMPMKVFLILSVVIAVFGILGRNSGVSHLTHLMGLAVAYVWLARYHRDWDFSTWRWR